MPIDSPVVRSNRELCDAQTSVSSSCTVPSCNGCCWWVQVLWTARTSSSSRRTRQIGSRRPSTNRVSPGSRSSRLATISKAMTISFLWRPGGGRAGYHAPRSSRCGPGCVSRAAADVTARDGAATEQAARMAAEVVERVEGSVVPVQQDLPSVGLYAGGHVVRHFLFL